MNQIWEKNKKWNVVNKNNHKNRRIKKFITFCACMTMIMMAITGCGPFSHIAPEAGSDDGTKNMADGQSSIENDSSGEGQMAGNAMESQDDQGIFGENLITVGISQLGSESVWRTANTLSIQNEFTQANGYFLLFNNARQKKENQIKALRDFISQQVDYIVFSPVEEDGYSTVLKEAKDAGIPVILMDRTVISTDTYLVKAMIGSDFKEEGEKAGKWLEEELWREGRSQDEVHIVVLKGTEGSSSQIGRSVGFQKIANEHSNWEIIDEEFADFTSKKGEEVMKKFLNRYDDIDVVVSQNDDMTFGAIKAIREANRTLGNGQDIMMISFDAVSEALELVKDGVISVDIECNPMQGEYVSSVIKKLSKGEETEKRYYVDEQVFTSDNVTDEVIAQRAY